MASLNFNLGLNLGTGLGTGGFSNVSGVGGANTATFTTIPVTNTQIPLYMLSIRDFNAPYSALYGYIFPLSPASITKEFTAYTNIYDVQGGADLGGVQRIADVYGQSMPTFTIEGTTGWQFHSTDGFAFTGLDSILVVQSLLGQYASLNRAQQLANQPLYPLEYYDYFSGEFWQVVPIGPQTVRQDQSRPLLFNYAFKFAAVGFVLGQTSQNQQSDATDNLLGISGSQGISNANADMSNTLNDYMDST